MLFDKISTLPKIGPKISKLIEKLANGDRVIDLIYHLPDHVLSRKYLPPLTQIRDKDLVILKLKVESHIQPSNNRQPFKIRCFNDSGFITLLFFKTFPNYINRNFAVGSNIAISGKIERSNHGVQMSHPDHVVNEKFIDQIPKNEMIYPLAAGLNQKFLANSINNALSKIPQLPEWIDLNLLKKNSWPSWKEAILSIHNPNIKNNSSRKRLAYDELLAFSIASLIAKKDTDSKAGRSTIKNDSLRNNLIENLPFKLTDGQIKVLSEIDADMASDKKMLRLLQGDVGAGKTIVALLSALSAIENNRQVAFIVPISLLAEQHFNTLNEFTKNLDINIELLTSKNTKKQKQKILLLLKSGEIDLIIGTHCLLYEDVIFKDLSLIIIDEQHRFGVLQRLELVKKGIKPDVLLMSATPIPRSLMMTLYDDMDISILSQKPNNREEIDTRVISLQRINEIYQSIDRSLEKKEKIYWICPLIEESEDMGYGNVNDRYLSFQKQFGKDRVRIIHGKMKSKEKEEIMKEFAQEDGKVQILIATTVIEVGIDVSDATIMIIENCERFGLSQLHQLRGRVGRSDKKSYCLLLYGFALGDVGKKRLSIMKHTNDGFKIAEEDLKIRGFGQILGTKQSGVPEYKIADLSFDSDLLATSHKNAQFVLNQDPKLESKIGQAIRILLRIFKYNKCMKLIQGG